jgi:hypothetical protein
VCDWRNAVQEFIGEDDLDTFEGWLRYQAIDPATITPEDLEMWRRHFIQSRQDSLVSPKVGLMKLKPDPLELRFAVAVREISELWLVLWVRRSPRGEFFVMMPQADRSWNPHTSYHLDGRMHMKSHNRKVFPRKRQPLTGFFQGSEHLGMFGGYAPKGVGAICDPADFTGIVEVPPKVLGPRHGEIVVDLVEPGREPISMHFSGSPMQKVFRDCIPWVVIRIGSCSG